MSGIANSSRAFDALTLTPYRILNPGADQRVHVLRLLRRGIAARADRPDGLVRDHGGREGAHAAYGQYRVELSRNHLGRAIALAFFESLPDAQHRNQALRLRGQELARDECVALGVDLTAFRVSNQDVSAADVLQHGSRDFAGESALRFRAQ